MSRCSKKCNEIKEKIDSISGLDDDYVYSWLKSLESVTSSIVGFINTYADRNELNGTFFKDEIDIDSIEELKSVTNNIDGTVCIMVKINELVQAVKQLNKKVKETETLDIEINENDINEAIKKARKQLKED